MKTALTILGVFLCAATQACAVAQSTWVQSAGGGPGSRYGHAMVYDSHRGATVLFGGGGGGGAYLGDTWEWNGSVWTMVAASGPSGRFGHSMAFDSHRGRTIMYGGSGVSGGVLHDTWEWDGATWTLLDNNGPATFQFASAMCFDGHRNVVVLSAVFGGVCSTWEWSAGSSAWISKAGFLGPNSISMAFDAQRGKSVLFNQGSLAWEWDGVTWIAAPLALPVPGARSVTAVAHDSFRSKTILFGGGTAGPFYADTWQWDGTAWAPMAISGPAARGWHAMSYDSQRNRIVLFGGQNNGGPLGDTWELETPVAVASAQTFGSGCGSPVVTMTPSSGSRPLVGQSQVSDIDNAFLGIAFVAWGLSNQVWGTVPLPVALDPYGFSGCMLWHSADGALGMGSTSTSWSTAQHTLAIPFAPSFVGAHIYLQAWTIASGFNPAGIAMSNGVELVLGNM